MRGTRLHYGSNLWAYDINFNDASVSIAQNLMTGWNEPYEMSKQDPFMPQTDGLIPQADAARQAIDSLRGYAYQVTVAALAWLDIEAASKIFLEVAEDYAIVVKDAISAVQVKDTQASTTITLNTDSVRDAIVNFVTLVDANSSTNVHLRYFTTSGIGTEKALQDRPNGMAGILYWRSAAKGADVEPLRTILESDKFPEAVHKFVKCRSDDELRRDLLRKIHWDCGKPDLAYLRKELQDRLIVLGRDDFNIPAQDAIRISDILIQQVLEKSIAALPAERVLTRSDLYTIIDNSSRMSVPIAMMDIFSHISAGLLTQMQGGSTSLPVTLGAPAWLIDRSDLPASKKTVSRPEIESRIEKKLRTFGACFVVGASGVGKSSVSKSVAERIGNTCFIVDFRNADAEETLSRLHALLSRLGGIPAQVILLEDLNEFNDPSLAAMTARVFEAMNRRDIAVIVTTYTSPTSKTLSNIGQQPDSTIDCPYFSEEESKSLVELHGGDSKIWGKLAHISGAHGHPQLVHAFIAGMAARSWPLSEIPAIFDAGLSTGDVTAEREASRRSLISVLPKSARNLLYRLSLTIGTFNRATALNIAATPPPISQAGEALDTLIGPWIETTGRDSYRISPLAAQSGKEMIASELQQRIHSSIASQFMSKKSINAVDIDKIILHAMLGKNNSVLATLTIVILTSSEQLTNFLAENFTILELFETDKPIYPNDSFISSILRLAQFKVLSAKNEKKRIAACVHSLLQEVDRSESGQATDLFKILSLGTILTTMGIANHLDNWLELLLQFHATANNNIVAKEMLKNIKTTPNVSEDSVIGSLFAIGSANLASVAKLEQLIDRLNQLENEQRTMLLNFIGETSPDYSVLINGPWVIEEKSLNAIDATERYQRMAVQTANWGIRPLTIQCWVAKAVILDEYANDPNKALETLDNALIENGDDVLIQRARAKIYWRAQNHERALSIMRGIADVVGRDNHVERAFALRSAAISAANCNDWIQAEKWFLESQQAASQVELPDMNVMAVGLSADAAIAAFKLGKIERCLKELSSVLTILSGIDPASSLRANHCHHLVRHSVLWVQSCIEKRDIMIDGAPISMQPGVCSNPEPVKEIAERALGSIDITWYMLAEIELTSRVDAGVLGRLPDWLVNGPIPMMEISLRTRRLICDIEDINPNGFTDHLLSYLAGMSFLAKNTYNIREEFNVTNPARQVIPEILESDVYPDLSRYADDAVLAYAISCVCRESSEELLKLGTSLAECFGPSVIAEAIFTRAKGNTGNSPSATFEHILIDLMVEFQSGTHQMPRSYCLAAVRFLQQAQHSQFRKLLVSIIAAWQREAWKRIIVSEKFQLSQPRLTVPEIEKVLSIQSNNVRFLSQLILATVDATNIRLSQELRNELRRLAETEQPN